jgi:hypothetical protein
MIQKDLINNCITNYKEILSMGKLRLDISSTESRGNYGIVDLIFNGVTIAPLKQLSATVESLEYDVDILTAANNILKVAVLNPQAYDANGDGDYTNIQAGDQVLQAVVSALSYSADGVNFTTLLPQVEITRTIPSGPKAGTVYILTYGNSSFISYGPDYFIEFNSDGIVTNEYIRGVRVKVLEDGNFLVVQSGDIFDLEANKVN